MNSNKFTKELGFITNDNIRKFTETALDNLPQYFFECADSSTGNITLVVHLEMVG